MWCLVIETHYDVLKQGGSLERAHMAVEQVLEDADEELADLMYWMYDGYVRFWGADPGWKILAIEHSAQVRLPTPRGGRSSFLLKMKIDLVVQERRTGNIKVVDHKSGKDLPKARALELDDQFGLYTWGMRQLGKRVFSSEWNATRTLRLQNDLTGKMATPLDERFSRTPLYRTDKELNRIAIEAYQIASARYRERAAEQRQGLDPPRHTHAARRSVK